MTTFSGFGGMTEAELKQWEAYKFAPGDGVATSGVLSGFGVTQTTTASGSVVVAIGAGLVQDARISGATPCLNNANATVDVFTAAPMSGISNPRNDIVVFNPATESIQVLTGTPNAVPTDPTVATTLLKLARLRHAANATTIPSSKIDDLRVTTSLYGAAGPWKTFTPSLFSGMSGTPTGISSSINYARWRTNGPGTVQAQVSISRVSGLTITDGFGVSLPQAAAFRSLNCGTLTITGSGAPTNQSGIAFMSPDATKLIPVAYSNGYIDVAPLLDCRYSVTYEV